jgi:hypothetical protein
VPVRRTSLLFPARRAGVAPARGVRRHARVPGTKLGGAPGRPVWSWPTSRTATSDGAAWHQGRELSPSCVVSRVVLLTGCARSARC